MNETVEPYTPPVRRETEVDVVGTPAAWSREVGATDRIVAALAALGTARLSSVGGVEAVVGVRIDGDTVTAEEVEVALDVAGVERREVRLRVLDAIPALPAPTPVDVPALPLTSRVITQHGVDLPYTRWYRSEGVVRRGTVFVPLEQLDAVVDGADDYLGVEEKLALEQAGLLDSSRRPTEATRHLVARLYDEVEAAASRETAAPRSTWIRVSGVTSNELDSYTVAVAARNALAALAALGRAELRTYAFYSGADREVVMRLIPAAETSLHEVVALLDDAGVGFTAVEIETTAAD